MNLQPTEIVERCRSIFQTVREGTVIGAGLLWEIKTNDLWKGYAESFSEFTQMDLGISPSRASELLTIWDHYIIQGKLTPEQLQEAPTQNLYVARKLELPPVEQFNIAKTNSKRDINARLKTGGVQCEHEGYDIIQICSHCGARI